MATSQENPSLEGVVKILYKKVQGMDSQLSEMKDFMMAIGLAVESQTQSGDAPPSEIPASFLSVESTIRNRSVTPNETDQELIKTSLKESRITQAEVGLLLYRVAQLEAEMKQLKLKDAKKEVDLKKPTPEMIARFKSLDTILRCGYVDMTSQDGDWLWPVGPLLSWQSLIQYVPSSCDTVEECPHDVYSCPVLLPAELSGLEFRLRLSRSLPSDKVEVTLYPTISSYNRKNLSLPLRLQILVTILCPLTGSILFTAKGRRRVFFFDRLGATALVAQIPLGLLSALSTPVVLLQCKPPPVPLSVKRLKH